MIELACIGKQAQQQLVSSFLCIAERGRNEPQKQPRLAFPANVYPEAPVNMTCPLLHAGIPVPFELCLYPLLVSLGFMALLVLESQLFYLQPLLPQRRGDLRSSEGMNADEARREENRG